MFTLGAIGFLHELLVSEAERPFLLALCGAMMGLPFVLSADSRIRRANGDEEDSRWSHLP